jgi:hypothetical protein
VNGKCYVGVGQDLFARLCEHAKNRDIGPKLRNAIGKYGKDKFFIYPICYNMEYSDTKLLSLVEAELIVEFDAVKNGYNVQYASRGAGPYGEEFGEIMKGLWADQAYRDKVMAGLNVPEVRAAMSAGASSQWRDPAFHRRKSALSKKQLETSWQESQYRERMTENSRRQRLPEVRDKKREEQMRPEVRAKKSTSTKKQWENPAFQELRRSSARGQANNSARDKFGRFPSKKAVDEQAVRAQSRAAMLGRIWITDGVRDRHVRGDAPIPDGWFRGRMFAREQKNRRERDEFGRFLSKVNPAPS